MDGEERRGESSGDEGMSGGCIRMKIRIQNNITPDKSRRKAIDPSGSISLGAVAAGR